VGSAGGGWKRVANTQRRAGRLPDFTRNVFYAGQPECSAVVLQGPLFNFGLMALLFCVFLVVGTSLFVRSEQNR